MIGISARSLSMVFDGFHAVRDVSFDVAPGEFVTLLGPSGCGKTTLLKIISGFLTPTQGTIHLGAKDVTQVPPERRDTALCFQSYALFPHLTVRQNLEFGLRQKKVAGSEREKRIDDVVGQLDLGSQLEKLPNQLSGGQQQRVALGRALATRPSVILFDEPLSNLDAKLRDQVRIEIRRLQQQNGLTAIYVTHDQAEALAMSDRVFVMNAGRIEQSETPETLYHHPATSFVADFIGAANVFDAEVMGQNGSGLWQLRTAIGNLLVSSDQAPAAKRLRLCWRPEHAEFSQTGPNLIEASVRHRAFQGAFTELIVEAEGVSFRLQADETSLTVGDRTQLSLAPERITLLEVLP